MSNLPTPYPRAAAVLQRCAEQKFDQSLPLDAEALLVAEQLVASACDAVSCGDAAVSKPLCHALHVIAAIVRRHAEVYPYLIVREPVRQDLKAFQESLSKQHPHVARALQLVELATPTYVPTLRPLSVVEEALESANVAASKTRKDVRKVLNTALPAAIDSEVRELLLDVSEGKVVEPFQPAVLRTWEREWLYRGESVGEAHAAEAKAADLEVHPVRWNRAFGTQDNEASIAGAAAQFEKLNELGNTKDEGEQGGASASTAPRTTLADRRAWWETVPSITRGYGIRSALRILASFLQHTTHIEATAPGQPWEEAIALVQSEIVPALVAISERAAPVSLYTEALMGLQHAVPLLSRLARGEGPSRPAPLLLIVLYRVFLKPLYALAAPMTSYTACMASYNAEGDGGKEEEPQGGVWDPVGQGLQLGSGCIVLPSAPGHAIHLTLPLDLAEEMESSKQGYRVHGAGGEEADSAEGNVYWLQDAHHFRMIIHWASPQASYERAMASLHSMDVLFRDETPQTSRAAVAAGGGAGTSLPHLSFALESLSSKGIEGFQDTINVLQCLVRSHKLRVSEGRSKVLSHLLHHPVWDVEGTVWLAHSHMQAIQRGGRIFPRIREKASYWQIWLPSVEAAAWKAAVSTCGASPCATAPVRGTALLEWQLRPPSSPYIPSTSAMGTCLATLMGLLCVLPRHTGPSDRLAAYALDKEAVRAICVKFNSSPRKGLQYLVDQGYLSDLRTAPAAVQLISSLPLIHTSSLGEALGTNSKHVTAIRRSFIRSRLDLNKPLLSSLRHLFVSFRVPGEAQVIERVLEDFSKEAWGLVQEKQSLLGEDTAFLLSFSLLMLNTSLHNRAVAIDKKMTEAAFISQNKDYGPPPSGVSTDSENRKLPVPFLQALYRRISKIPLAPAHELAGADVFDEAPLCDAFWRAVHGNRGEEGVEQGGSESKEDMEDHVEAATASPLATSDSFERLYATVHSSFDAMAFRLFEASTASLVASLHEGINDEMARLTHCRDLNQPATAALVAGSRGSLQLSMPSSLLRQWPSCTSSYLATLFEGIFAALRLPVKDQLLREKMVNGVIASFARMILSLLHDFTFAPSGRAAAVANATCRVPLPVTYASIEEAFLEADAADQAVLCLQPGDSSGSLGVGVSLVQGLSSANDNPAADEEEKEEGTDSHRQGTAANDQSRHLPKDAATMPVKGIVTASLVEALNRIAASYTAYLREAWAWLLAVHIRLEACGIPSLGPTGTDTLRRSTPSGATPSGADIPPLFLAVSAQPRGVEEEEEKVEEAVQPWVHSLSASQQTLYHTCTQFPPAAATTTRRRHGRTWPANAVASANAVRQYKEAAGSVLQRRRDVEAARKAAVEARSAQGAGSSGFLSWLLKKNSSEGSDAKDSSPSPPPVASLPQSHIDSSAPRRAATPEPEQLAGHESAASARGATRSIHSFSSFDGSQQPQVDQGDRTSLTNEAVTSDAEESLGSDTSTTGLEEAPLSSRLALDSNDAGWNTATLGAEAFHDPSSNIEAPPTTMMMDVHRSGASGLALSAFAQCGDGSMNALWLSFVKGIGALPHLQASAAASASDVGTAASPPMLVSRPLPLRWLTKDTLATLQAMHGGVWDALALLLQCGDDNSGPSTQGSSSTSDTLVWATVAAAFSAGLNVQNATHLLGCAMAMQQPMGSDAAAETCMQPRISCVEDVRFTDIGAALAKLRLLLQRQTATAPQRDSDPLQSLPALPTWIPTKRKRHCLAFLGCIARSGHSSSLGLTALCDIVCSQLQRLVYLPPSALLQQCFEEFFTAAAGRLQDHWRELPELLDRITLAVGATLPSSSIQDQWQDAAGSRLIHPFAMAFTKWLARQELAVGATAAMWKPVLRLLMVSSLGSPACAS